MDDYFFDLIKHLRSIKHDYETGLTAKKVLERAYNVDTQYGVLTFDMERHSSILGGSYVAGLAMSAFSARTESYSYDPESKVIIRTNVSEPVVDPDDIDYSGLAEQFAFDMSFEFEFDRDHGKYKMSEICLNFEGYVADLDEALRAADSLVDPRSLESDVFHELGGFGEEVQKQVVEQIVQAQRNLLREMVCDAWETRQGGPDEPYPKAKMRYRQS